MNNHRTYIYHYFCLYMIHVTGSEYHVMVYSLSAKGMLLFIGNDTIVEFDFQIWMAMSTRETSMPGQYFDTHFWSESRDYRSKQCYEWDAQKAKKI